MSQSVSTLQMEVILYVIWKEYVIQTACCNTNDSNVKFPVISSIYSNISKSNHTKNSANVRQLWSGCTRIVQ
jgi:hypothetical protein